MLRSLFGDTDFPIAIEFRGDISLIEKEKWKEAKVVRMEIEPVILDAVPPSTCMFCCKFTTSIDFDMNLHLYENHRRELYRLPIGKGFSIDSRIRYAIDEGRKIYDVREKLKMGQI